MGCRPSPSARTSLSCFRSSSKPLIYIYIYTYILVNTRTYHSILRQALPVPGPAVVLSPSVDTSGPLGICFCGAVAAWLAWLLCKPGRICPCVRLGVIRRASRARRRGPHPVAAAACVACPRRCSPGPRSNSFAAKLTRIARVFVPAFSAGGCDFFSSRQASPGPSALLVMHRYLRS